MLETVFKSKYGFHPCSVETFRKLRVIKKMYWQCLYDFCRWNRWQVKTKYRKGSEPKYNSLFVLDKFWFKKTQRKDKDGILRDHYKGYPKTVTDHGFLELFQQGRFASKEPVVLFSPEIIKKIDDFYDRCKGLERVAA